MLSLSYRPCALCTVPVTQAVSTVYVQFLSPRTCAHSMCKSFTGPVHCPCAGRAPWNSRTVYRSPSPCAIILYSSVTRILPVSPHCATCQPWHFMHLPIRNLTALLTVQLSVTKLTFHIQSAADSRNMKAASKLPYKG